MTLSVDGMPMSEYTYTPGETVAVTVTVTDPDASQVVRGFQITAQAPLGCFQAGDFAQAEGDMGVLIRDDSGVRRPRPICPDAVIQYPTHNAPKPAQDGAARFELNWTAPDVNVGPILFAAAGNAANGNFSNQGDRIYLVQERIVPGTLVAPTNAASFLGPTFAANEIVAVFGQDFTNDTEIANDTPLPTTLAGVTVEVTDSAGETRQAPQFFASPGQVNAMIPEGTAEGMATLSVISDGDPQSTTIHIRATGPGVFAVNQIGSGPAAAGATRVDAMGVQTPVAVIDGTGAPVPIDLGPEADQVVLLIFATGVRGAQTVEVTMGGETAEVIGFGEQGDFVGLDQINAIIPRSLIGMGEIDVQVIVDGRPANVVTVTIQ